MAKDDRNKPFYQKLSRLFRSGPRIRTKITGQDTKAYYDKSVVQQNLGYYGGAGFKRESSPFSVLGAYGIMDRVARYSEFVEMQYQPEINTALDVYADEICSGDEQGHCFHVFSNNRDVKRTLEDLFFNVMNIEADLRRWARNLVTYGDFFLYLEVQPDVGIFHAEPLLVSNVERQQFFDPEDPYAVRFKLIHSNKILENWQVLHFRVVNNELFLPYGTSLLEAVRRTWRTLVMLEDSMLLYRVHRSAECRVFYIDTTGVPPNDVGNYMEQVMESIKGKDVVDKLTGRSDFRFNPLTVLDDYFIPLKLNDKTKIETLPGGQHVSAVEDVEYMQKKLIAGLKVPKAYLTYTEDLSSKAGLAMEDIRFSRTISALQKIIVSELNKAAILHLFAKGFEGEDLIDFELRLSNPSTIAIQQKLQTWSSKFDIATKAKESGLVDETWIQQELLGLTEDVINKVRKGRAEDKLRELRIEKMTLPKELGPQNSPFLNPFDAAQVPTSLNASGIDAPSLDSGNSDVGNVPGGNIIKPDIPGREVLMVNTMPTSPPLKASMTPDVNRMLSPKNKSFSSPGEDDILKDISKNKTSLLEEDLLAWNKTGSRLPLGLPVDILSMLETFSERTALDRRKIVIEVSSGEQKKPASLKEMLLLETIKQTKREENSQEDSKSEEEQEEAELRGELTQLINSFSIK